ncbi:uncharacterized protein BROUX77_007255 [Berkeleyomyces rouxiae]|uniref:uncharacterized protein n=1 Tax=Berkeleyomyces rouxiae TaxID=2035830 RepID=UPI003B80CBF4
MGDRSHYQRSPPQQHQQPHQQQQRSTVTSFAHLSRGVPGAITSESPSNMAYTPKSSVPEYTEYPGETSPNLSGYASPTREAFFTTTPRTAHGSESTMTSPRMSAQAVYNSTGTAHRYQAGQKAPIQAASSATTSPQPERGYRSPPSHGAMMVRSRSRSPSPSGRITYVMSDSGRMYGVSSASNSGKRSKSHVRGRNYASPTRDYDQRHPDDYLERPASPHADFPQKVGASGTAGGRFNAPDRFDRGRMHYTQAPAEVTDSDYKYPPKNVDGYDTNTRNERDTQHQRPVLMYDQGRKNLNVTTTTTIENARRGPLMNSSRPDLPPRPGKDAYETSPQNKQLEMQLSPRASTANTNASGYPDNYYGDYNSIGLTPADEHDMKASERRRLTSRFVDRAEREQILKRERELDHQRMLQLEYRDEAASNHGFNSRHLDLDFDDDHREMLSLPPPPPKNNRADIDRERRPRAGNNNGGGVSGGYRSEDDSKLRQGRDMKALKDKTHRELSRMAEDRRYKRDQSVTPEMSDFEGYGDDTLGDDDFAIVDVVPPDRSAIRDEREGGRKRTKNESPTKHTAQSRTRERERISKQRAEECDDWEREQEEKQKWAKKEREQKKEEEGREASRKLKEDMGSKTPSTKANVPSFFNGNLPPTPPKDPETKGSSRSPSMSPTSRAKKPGPVTGERLDVDHHEEPQSNRVDGRAVDGARTPPSSAPASTPASASASASASPRSADTSSMEKTTPAFDTTSLTSEEDEEAQRGRAKPTPDVPEKKQVRVVSPKREKSQVQKKLRGILKAPSKFPENREDGPSNAAGDKDDGRQDGSGDSNPVPEGARWTLLSRRIVNCEALDMANEKYDVMDDQIIVMRVLTHNEIQLYANATTDLRAKRAEKRRKRITHRDEAGESSRKSTRSSRHDKRRDESRDPAERERRREKRRERERERTERDPYRERDRDRARDRH